MKDIYHTFMRDTQRLIDFNGISTYLGIFYALG